MNTKARLLTLAGPGNIQFLGNYPEFPDSPLSLQFPLFIHITNMLVNSSRIFAEELRHLLLSKPKTSPIR